MSGAYTMFKTASPLRAGCAPSVRCQRLAQLRVSAKGDGARVDKFSKKDVMYVPKTSFRACTNLRLVDLGLRDKSDGPAAYTDLILCFAVWRPPF